MSFYKIIPILIDKSMKIETLNLPHVSREDGGHIFVSPVESLSSRQELNSKQANELMKFTIVAGRALKEVLTQSGVDIQRINYQDNGNWVESLHVNIYGRASGAIKQPLGTALQFAPTQDEFKEQQMHNKPLTRQEITRISERVQELLENEYAKFI